MVYVFIYKEVAPSPPIFSFFCGSSIHHNDAGKHNVSHPAVHAGFTTKQYSRTGYIHNIEIL